MMHLPIVQRAITFDVTSKCSTGRNFQFYPTSYLRRQLYCNEFDYFHGDNYTDRQYRLATPCSSNSSVKRKRVRTLSTSHSKSVPTIGRPRTESRATSQAAITPIIADGDTLWHVSQANDRLLPQNSIACCEEEKEEIEFKPFPVPPPFQIGEEHYESYHNVRHQIQEDNVTSNHERGKDNNFSNSASTAARLQPFRLHETDIPPAVLSQKSSSLPYNQFMNFTADARSEEKQQKRISQQTKTKRRMKPHKKNITRKIKHRQNADKSLLRLPHARSRNKSIDNTNINVKQLNTACNITNTPITYLDLQLADVHPAGSSDQQQSYSKNKSPSKAEPGQVQSPGMNDSSNASITESLATHHTINRKLRWGKTKLASSKHIRNKKQSVASMSGKICSSYASTVTTTMPPLSRHRMHSIPLANQVERKIRAQLARSNTTNNLTSYRVSRMKLLVGAESTKYLH